MSEKELQEIKEISTIGDIPLNRFGHSIVFLSKINICLFGGFVGDSRKLNYSNETFVFNILTKIWRKIHIQDKDSLPKERAAHAAAANEKGEMLIYGGSTNKGGLAEDCLYAFSLNPNNQNEGEWSKINTTGNTPGERYGHSLMYLNPNFILFGGNCNPNLCNDIWLININDKNNCQWVKLEFTNDKDNIPIERLYHSSDICNYGKYQNNLMIFGGRDKNNNPLNDLWALDIKDEKGTWTKLFPSGEKDINSLTPRINHTMLFYEHFLIILGGKTLNINPVPIEVFDTETSECYKFKKLLMNRHTSFIFDKDIFFFGGLNLKEHIPLGGLFKVSLTQIFSDSPLSKSITQKNNSSDKLNNKDKEKNQYKLSHDVVIGSGNSRGTFSF